MRYTRKNTMSINIEFVHSAFSRISLEQNIIDDLLYKCRIPNHLLQEPNARVSLVQFAQLMSGLMAKTDDELIGHGNSALPLGSFSLLTHWLVAAKTLGQAVKRMARFDHILGLKQTIRSYCEGDMVYFEIDSEPNSETPDTFIAEFYFFMIHRLLSWLVMEVIHIDHVELQFDKPTYAQDYQLLFYGAPTLFNRSATRFCFAHSQLEKPIQQKQPNLEKFLENPYFELLVLDFKADNLASRVAAEIRKKLDAMPALPELAEAMNMKSYTLQRRLADEGISYLAIKNQVKRDAAIDFLVNTDLSIEEISVQLGFSETSPFTRTFKEWTGIPPSAYRKYN